MNRDSTKTCRQFFRYTDFLYLGRGIHYPNRARRRAEAKEISTFMRRVSAGEIEARPHALIDENLPVVVGDADESDHQADDAYEKSVSNIKEVKARDGMVILLHQRSSRRGEVRSTYRTSGPRGIARGVAGNLFLLNCSLITSRCGALDVKPTAQPGHPSPW